MNAYCLATFILCSGPEELKWIIQEVKYRIAVQSAKLVRQVKRKDRLRQKFLKNCDIVTACLQAVSQKRRNYKSFSHFTPLPVIMSLSSKCSITQSFLCYLKTNVFKIESMSFLSLTRDVCYSLKE